MGVFVVVVGCCFDCCGYCCFGVVGYVLLLLGVGGVYC